MDRIGSPKTPERRAQMPNFLSLSIRQAAVNVYQGDGGKICGAITN
jgi:hypothetical protein